MDKPTVVVVGSINTDFTVISERLPQHGETVTGGRFVEAGGGKGANQAVAAARAGAEVLMVGRVGDDAQGRRRLDDLRAEGVGVGHVTTDAEAHSGIALIMVGAVGENIISVASGANARLSPGDVRAAFDAIGRADVVVMQMEIPVETVLEAVRAGREAGALVILNPAPVPDGGVPAEAVGQLDCITPNRGEAARIVGARPDAEPEELVRQLVAAGAASAVMTLGADGVCACDGEEVFRLPAAPAEPVDTVGAGDCFAGCLAVALGEGRGLREAARLAVAAAAVSVERAGAQPSMPSRAEIEERLDAAGPA